MCSLHLSVAPLPWLDVLSTTAKDVGLRFGFIILIIQLFLCKSGETTARTNLEGSCYECHLNSWILGCWQWRWVPPKSVWHTEVLFGILQPRRWVIWNGLLPKKIRVVLKCIIISGSCTEFKSWMETALPSHHVWTHPTFRALIWKRFLEHGRTGFKVFLVTNKNTFMNTFYFCWLSNCIGKQAGKMMLQLKGWAKAVKMQRSVDIPISVVLLVTLWPTTVWHVQQTTMCRTRPSQTQFKMGLSLSRPDAVNDIATTRPNYRCTFWKSSWFVIVVWSFFWHFGFVVQDVRFINFLRPPWAKHPPQGFAVCGQCFVPHVEVCVHLCFLVGTLGVWCDRFLCLFWMWHVACWLWMVVGCLTECCKCVQNVLNVLGLHGGYL